MLGWIWIIWFKIQKTLLIWISKRSDENNGSDNDEATDEDDEPDLSVDGDVEGDEEDQGGDTVHHQVSIDQVKPGCRGQQCRGEPGLE